MTTITPLPLRDFQPDFKTPERIRDTAAIRRKVFSDRTCRGCRRDGHEGHHILLRSLGGDDVEENIVPLCTYCHLTFHSGAPGVRSQRSRSSRHGRPRGRQVRGAVVQTKGVPDETQTIGGEIGASLRREEVGYLVGKLGEGRAVAYLRRYYGWSRRDWERKHGPLVVATPTVERFAI